ncbi:MAG: NADP-dependent isocitrate dehydrogenase [Microbacteriaceae bacterium]|jgi:isocitrate dehydrogenase|nr:NADP-dependent isocitrate dehydrogenase [Microbacteriaceae bacterium]MCI1207057.1 NADP-dependent isocitrate dehydrogenase [Microbacteriaceae bacterium]
MARLTYTITDETPRLATASLLPIVEAFSSAAGVSVRRVDLSLAARILAQFPERLRPEQRVPDALAELGELVTRPEANLVKLPNISASVPQLVAAVAELQAHGYDLPDYPETPETEEERDVRARYDRVKGSAVNPVLRQGNADRRAPAAVKAFERAHPHQARDWDAASRTAVATMSDGDFHHTERTLRSDRDRTVRVVLQGSDGIDRVLHPGIRLQAGELLDAAVLRSGALDGFLRDSMARAAHDGLLASVHLKATMMKVSDPIEFGHAVRAAYPRTFAEFGEVLAAAGAAPERGLGAVSAALTRLPPETARQVRARLEDDRVAGPELAYPDPEHGVCGLDAPNKVIVDASMAALIRDGGQLRDRAGAWRDTLAIIPDSSYAGVYQAAIDDFRTHGTPDPAGLGTVQNVGLMAGKAEEYGSHDKTFLIDAPGRVVVLDEDGTELLDHPVAPGDLWRACQTKPDAVADWTRLALRRALTTGLPAVFWLDPERPHDRALAEEARRVLAAEETAGADLRFLDPVAATIHALGRLRAGQDTIAVTGNVLRDYLTDLFPVIETGTSSKMLSIVPMLAGGGMFETGAGGSAPDLTRRFLDTDHLDWDSMGECFAVAESLRFAGEHGAPAASVLANAADAATERLLVEDRGPKAGVGAPDTRVQHYWLAREWAAALAAQTQDVALAARFAPVAEQLAGREGEILQELLAVQGSPVDLGGYYQPDPARLDAAMRPSAALNRILDQVRFGSQEPLNG